MSPAFCKPFHYPCSFRSAALGTWKGHCMVFLTSSLLHLPPPIVPHHSWDTGLSCFSVGRSVRLWVGDFPVNATPSLPPHTHDSFNNSWDSGSTLRGSTSRAVLGEAWSLFHQCLGFPQRKQKLFDLKTDRYVIFPVPPKPYLSVSEMSFILLFVKGMLPVKLPHQ